MMKCSCWNDVVVVGLVEAIPLHTWTATGLVVIVMSGNWFVMVMKNVDVVDWWKPVSDYWILVLDKDEEYRMTDDLGYVIDECGRFSISSWLVNVALSPKTESHLKSLKFEDFQFRLIISIVHHKKPLRLAFGTSMCNISELWFLNLVMKILWKWINHWKC